RDETDPDNAARDTPLSADSAGRRRPRLPLPLRLRLWPFGFCGPGGHSDLDSHAQARRGRARVRRGLARAGPNRLARERTKLRFLAAHANGEVRRALAAALEVPHETLRDPILERVEADHR